MPRLNYDKQHSRGFHLSFSNGWTVSVQFGRYNYCENKNYRNDNEQPSLECPDAEIAAVHESGKWFKFEGDEDNDTSVKGYVSDGDVAKFIYKVSQLKGVK